MTHSLSYLLCTLLLVLIMYPITYQLLRIMYLDRDYVEEGLVIMGRHIVHLQERRQVAK